MESHNRLIVRRLAMGIAASTVLTTGAHAQAPWIDPDVVAGRTHASTTSDGDPVATDPGLQRELQQRMERHRLQLLPEYRRRLHADGKPRADAWLRDEAVARGEREADSLRGRLLRG